MSGEQRRLGAPEGPPWSPELLADLHAGALDAHTDAQLRPRIEQDPGAGQVLAALDATRTAIATEPSAPMPDDVAARITAVLASEPGIEEAGAQAHDFASARSRRSVRWSWGLLAAAAAVVAAVIVSMTRPTEQVASPPLALPGNEVRLDSAQLTEVLHSRQYATPLTDAAALRGCLQANGASDARPLGAREVTLNGRLAQLLILPTATVGRFRLLTVGSDCGPGNAAVVSDTTVGG